MARSSRSLNLYSCNQEFTQNVLDIHSFGELAGAEKSCFVHTVNDNDQKVVFVADDTNYRIIKS